MRIPLLWLPIKFDEAIFAHIGNMWLRHGQLLYLDAIDNKPPGVFLVYGGLFKLTGHLDIIGPRLASAASIAAAGVVLALWGTRVFSRTAGILAGVCLVSFSGIIIAPPAYTETFMIAFTTASFYLAYIGLRRQESLWFAGAGVAVATAMMFKQIALLDLIALGVGLAWIAVFLPDKRNIARYGLMTTMIAAGAVVAVVALLLYGGGQLAAASDAVLLNPWYTARTHSLPGLLEGLQRLSVVVIGCLPLLGGIVITLWKARSQATLAICLLVPWLIMTFVGSIASGRIFFHQLLPVLPPLCLLAAPGLVWTWQVIRSLPSRQRQLVGTLAGLVVIGAAIGVLRFQGGRYGRVIASITQQQPHPSQLVGAYVRKHTHFDEPIYVLGRRCGIYLYADRPAASRYFHQAWAGLPEVEQHIVTDVQTTLPAMLIFADLRYGRHRRLAAAFQESIIPRYYRSVKVPGAEDFEVFVRSK